MHLFENHLKIVYDSPVKTSYDLERAIKAGVHINLAWFSFHYVIFSLHNTRYVVDDVMIVRKPWKDNLQEIAKVNELLATSCKGVDVEGRIGIRVNPEVGAGKIAMSSTAGRSSKFGLLMRGEFESEVLDLFKVG